MTGPAAGHTRLRMVHASMQFSDSPAQKAADVETIFDFADRRKVAWLTGTEAGAGDKAVLRTLLRQESEDRGYRFWMHPAQDSWLAVDRELVQGNWTTYYEKVVDGKAGVSTDKGVLSFGFDNRLLGRINLIACHYQTKGRKPGDPRYQSNVNLTRKIGAYATEVGKGSALVFYGGDQNIVDRTDDTFMGQPLTSCWDELGKWPNTGHGNIDVIASYDRDGRVKAVGARALDDSEVHLHTDHFMIEATYDVRNLRLK